MKGTRVNPDGSITFCYNHYSASSVQVAGSFSNWQPLNLQKGSEGWWFLRTEPLNSGDYEYLFVVDGDWTGDQFNMLKAGGGQNSFINVGGQRGSLLRNSFFSHALGRKKIHHISSALIFLQYRGLLPCALYHGRPFRR